MHTDTTMCCWQITTRQENWKMPPRSSYRHLRRRGDGSCTYLVQYRSGVTGSRKLYSGKTTGAHSLAGTTGIEHSLPGFTTPPHIRWGFTGRAHILLGDTTGAQILAGVTGKLKVLAGATTTAQGLGLKPWGKQPWHEASPEEIKIRPISTMRTRRMQLTCGQKTSSRLLLILQRY
jgi:hypothetical protein